MSVIWIYDFAVNYSVKTQLELILVAVIKGLRESLLLTVDNILVLISTSARIETPALKMPFVEIEKEVTSAFVILDSKVKHVRILMNALITKPCAISTLIVLILQEVSSVHARQVSLVQVNNVKRANVRTRFAPITRDARP